MPHAPLRRWVAGRTWKVWDQEAAHSLSDALSPHICKPSSKRALGSGPTSSGYPHCTVNISLQPPFWLAVTSWGAGCG